MKKILIIICISSMVKVEAQTSAFANVDSLLQIGRYKLALNQLEKIPSTFESNAKKASIYEAIDNHKKASIYYKKALQKQDDYKTKIKLGISYRKQKKLQKAVQVFEDIIKKDPKNMLMEYQLGKLYLQIKNSERAVKTFKNLIEKDDENANYSYQLALAYAQLKKRNLKINSLLKAYKKDSTHIKSIERLAIDFLLLRDIDSSKLFIKKGLKINPNNIKLNRLKINDLFRNKKYNKALTLLLKLNLLQPNERYTQKMLARTYYNLEDYKKAKKHFKKVLKLDPSDFKSYTYLGHISFKEKDFSKAMLQYVQATYVGKSMRDEEYYGVGQTFYEMKKVVEALKNFKKATQENPKNYEALYKLAVLSDDYYKDKRKAYKLYKRFIERFENKAQKMTEYSKYRIKKIEKDFFLKGKKIE